MDRCAKCGAPARPSLTACRNCKASLRSQPGGQANSLLPPRAYGERGKRAEKVKTGAKSARADE